MADLPGAAGAFVWPGRWLLFPGLLLKLRLPAYLFAAAQLSLHPGEHLEAGHRVDAPRGLFTLRAARGSPGLLEAAQLLERPATLADKRIHWHLIKLLLDAGAVRKDGTNESEVLTLAARNVLLNVIEHLGTCGFDRQQDYAICSAAADLRISQIVDVPNPLVSALLSLDIFM